MSQIPNKVRRLLERRPPRNDLQAQLFWLVDMILACSEGGMADEAAHLKRALGLLGRYLEQHSPDALAETIHELETFESLVAKRRTT